MKKNPRIFRGAAQKYFNLKKNLLLVLISATLNGSCSSLPAPKWSYSDFMRDCNYNLLPYFPNAKQSRLTYLQTIDWFSKRSVHGKNSAAHSEFISILKEYLNQQTNPQKIIILRIIINSSLTNNDKAYEIDWVRGQGIRIYSIQNGYLENFPKNRKYFLTTTLYCPYQTPIK